jgi:hypothetical protein
MLIVGQWSQVDHGLFAPKERTAIAVVGMAPEELTRRYGVRFTDDNDDFDALKIAVVELGPESRLAFIRYPGGQPWPCANARVRLATASSWSQRPLKAE